MQLTDFNYLLKINGWYKQARLDKECNITYGRRATLRSII